jgi:hypothetical protein
MTTQLSAMLGPVVMYERLRAAQNHRDPGVHAHPVPVGRERPWPVGPDALNAISARFARRRDDPGPPSQQPTLPPARS